MGNIPCPVNIGIDLTMGRTQHLAITIGMTAPVPNISIEYIATQLWLPGYCLNKNSLTTTVFHTFSNDSAGWIVLDGHNQGVFLLHLTSPIVPNLFLPTLIIPFSSREIKFTASTVKFNGKEVGCSCLLPTIPMMTCGFPCGLPLAFPLTNIMNTLKVGISWRDILKGYGKIAISVAADRIASKIASKIFKSNDLVDDVWKYINEQVFDELNPLNPETCMKNSLTALGEFGLGLFIGDPTNINMSFGSDYAGVEIGNESQSRNFLFYKGEHSDKGIKHSLGGTDIE